MNEIEQVLQQRFQLPAFRPGQQAAIEALLQGRSVLTVFPTGGGKSLCYQLPALMLEGLTLVISPLIALMQDQVDALTALNIPAARLDSTRNADEVRTIYQQMRDGELKLLFVAPERLQNERFLNVLRGRRISLLAVDEAHCISEWGHNFRPDYLKLAKLAQELQVERVLALTATATPEVAQDICRQFRIDVKDHIQTGFYRPNLQLSVFGCQPKQRFPRLLQSLKQQPGAPSIVYVTLQHTAERIAQQLQEEGLNAAAYHAGMKADKREQIQDAFMAGHINVVVATIAFGMGIDKADIRAVYHYNLPKSIENYMQEIGRAGRDGLPSRCELLACRDDLRVLANFSYGDTPITEHLQALLAHVLGQGDQFDLSLYELAGEFDIRPLVISTLLTYLELENVLRSTGPFYSTFQVKFKQPPEAICASFDPARADFLRAVFNAGKQGRIWLTIDTDKVAQTLGEPRDRLVRALQYLEENELIETQVKGVRQGYRKIANPDFAELFERIRALFERREQQDIKRLQEVVAYAESDRCLPQRLCDYFGESLSQPCGQCTPCVDGKPARLPEVDEPEFTARQQQLVDTLIAQQQPALQHPRQLARFLCGISSPATSRGPLRKHEGFGALQEYSFHRVLKRF